MHKSVFENDLYGISLQREWTLILANINTVIVHPSAIIITHLAMRVPFVHMKSI